MKILSVGATEGALNELLPQFETSSGHKVTIQYGPAGNIAARVAKGEPVDVLISARAEVEPLARDGKVVADSQAVIAKVGIGLFVRKGDLKPDISTGEAFVRALANAKVIAYGDPKLGGSASVLVADLLTSLDGNGSISTRTRLVPPAKPLVDLVAAGGVDFAFQPISQIFLDRRIDYVGPLPAPYQRFTDYLASLVSTSANREAYAALVAFLASPRAVAVIRARGFEPQ